MKERPIIMSGDNPKLILEGRKERRRKSKLAWKDRNPAKIKAGTKDYYARHKTTLNQKSNAWRRRNTDRVNARRRKLRDSDDVRATAAAYRRKRLQQNPILRAKDSLRRRLNYLIHSERESTVKMLGCSLASFQIYIESKFKPGMTWENYGTVWEIDHILPCALFDLTKPEHQRACFHFSNLQPLGKSENRRKGAKALCANAQ
jgi:hypothetical protein